MRLNGARSFVLQGSCGSQQLLLKAGARMIRLDIRRGTALAGPVRLHFLMGGMRDLGHRLATLRRFVALCRLGRFPAALFARDRRAARWIMMLRALDGLDEGASQRELAEGLFGPAYAPPEWRGDSDYLRLRVQRLVRTAKQIRDGGYLKLLHGTPPL